MKYKKWWTPAIFAAISGLFGVLLLIIAENVIDEASALGLLYYPICMGIWFLLVLPSLSVIYARRIVADERERILLTLYNSVLLVLPIAFRLTEAIFSWTDLIIYLAWAEMWAAVGLAGKGKKRLDVWYVPLFLGMAGMVVTAYLQVWVGGYLSTAVISCIACPIAITIYARSCVRCRKSKLLYTVYVSLAMLISMFGNILLPMIRGETTLESPVGDIIKLCLAIAGTFALYELTALLGAGVKLGVRRRKESAESEETETPEDAGQ